MPSIYAHSRFGEEVTRLLKQQDSGCCEAIEAYPELFAIGLHGPDIFFYYRPLTKNPVSAIGYGWHERSGRAVFTEMKQTVEALPPDGRRASLAYLYGFLCHFALDSSCHGYVGQAIEETGVPHTEIEGELDRKMMVEDGIEPLSHLLTGHFVPSLENACVISRFFSGATAAQIREAIRSMCAFDKLFLCPKPLKRTAVLTGMRLIGQYEGMHGMVLNPVPNPACAAAVDELIRLYRTALPLAVRLIEGFGAPDALSDPAYDRNFESVVPDR